MARVPASCCVALTRTGRSTRPPRTYSKAWGITKKVEGGLGFQLIDRFGARGSKLTDEGRLFLDLYEEYEKKVEDYAEKTFQEVFRDF